MPVLHLVQQRRDVTPADGREVALAPCRKDVRVQQSLNLAAAPQSVRDRVALEVVLGAGAEGVGRGLPGGEAGAYVVDDVACPVARFLELHGVGRAERRPALLSARVARDGDA